MKYPNEHHTRKAGQTGFTLLEVLVALSLVAITVIGVFSLQLQNIRLAESSRFDTETILAIHSVSAALATQSLDQLSLRGGGKLNGSIRDTTKWNATVTQWPEQATAKTAKGLYRIQVTVKDDINNREFSFVTYRSAGEN